MDESDIKMPTKLELEKMMAALLGSGPTYDNKLLNDWQYADYSKGQLDKFLIVMSLEDLSRWFAEFMDRHWLQVNLKTGLTCISYEGINYEPKVFGKIVKKVVP